MHVGPACRLELTAVDQLPISETWQLWDSLLTNPPRLLALVSARLLARRISQVESANVEDNVTQLGAALV